jgi:hypothetical protein
MLRGIDDLRRFSIAATDGNVGSVSDVYFDGRSCFPCRHSRRPGPARPSDLRPVPISVAMRTRPRGPRSSRRP